MAKVAYVCARHSQLLPSIQSRLRLAAGRLQPDNIGHVAPKILEREGVVIAIFGPAEVAGVAGCGVHVGKLTGNGEWQLPGRGSPEGTYALFRGNHDVVEVLTDVVASRTIWYFFSDDLFVASTSQRVIASVLGSFEPNEEVVPWMLSSGTLGPVCGWDRRVKRLEGDASVLLDRRSWVLTRRTTDIRFVPSPASDSEHGRLLRRAIGETLGAMEFDYSRWALPLSGGFDSRGILCSLEHRTGLRAVTWGLNSSLGERQSDACVAKELARHYGLAHEYYATDMTDEPVTKVFDRFLLCGEGRVDHIAGYMDGFATWRMLHENGVCGIIRGDHGFGLKPVSSPLQVRMRAGLRLWSDYVNLREHGEFGFAKQTVPEAFERRQDESLATWRDRLYHQFLIPVVLAALNDLKSSYVEIVNPFLARRIIYEVRRQPDRLRTGKELHKRIVRSASPAIPFARYRAIAGREAILRSQAVVTHMRDELSSRDAEALLPREFLDYVGDRIMVRDEEPNTNRRRGARRIIGSLLPAWVKTRVRNVPTRPRMDFNTLAFRAYIVCRMHKTLAADAAGAA